jgi:hypothetical protein
VKLINAFFFAILGIYLVSVSCLHIHGAGQQEVNRTLQPMFAVPEAQRLDVGLAALSSEEKVHITSSNFRENPFFLFKL